MYNPGASPLSTHDLDSETEAERYEPKPPDNVRRRGCTERKTRKISKGVVARVHGRRWGETAGFDTRGWEYRFVEEDSIVEAVAQGAP